MNYRNNNKSNIPPVRGSLTGKQARCECADLYGTKKDYFVSDEVNAIYHLAIPSDDGYKHIVTEAQELLDGLWMVNKKTLIRALARVGGREALDMLRKEIEG